MEGIFFLMFFGGGVGWEEGTQSTDVDNIPCCLAAFRMVLETSLLCSLISFLYFFFCCYGNPHIFKSLNFQSRPQWNTADAEIRVSPGGSPGLSKDPSFSA